MKNKHKPKLLYVDDMSASLLLFEELFSDSFEIYTASDEKAAYEILEKNKIDILLVDYILRNTTGVEILKYSFKNYPQVIRLIITAFSNSEILEKSINEGSIHGYIKKPINKEEVKILINNIYDKHFLIESNIALIDEIREAGKELAIQKKEFLKQVKEKKLADEKIKNLNLELEERVKKRTKELERANKKLSNEIFERLAAQQSLRMMQYSIDISATPTFWINPDGKFIYSNLAACKLLLIENIENIDLHYYDISAYWPSNVWDNKLKQLKKEGTIKYEDYFRKKNGTNVAVEVTISYIDFEGTEHLFVYANDISMKKTAEAELRKLSLAVQFSPISVMMTNIKGNIQYVNPKFTEISGYTKEEVIGKNPRILNAGKLPNKIYKELWDTILNGKEWKGQLCNKKKNGEIFWELVLIAPVFNENKEITNYVAVKEDITDRLKAEKELKLAKEEADAANKAKSEFLANMSHEIRTPMNAVMGFAELLSNMVTDETQKNYLDSIVSSGTSLLTIINDILDISKIEAGKISLNYSYVDIYSFFQDIKAIFSLRIEQKKLEFILDIDSSIPPSIYIDEVRLRQIILNLVGNAIKFTDKGYVKLIVKANNKRADKKNKSLELVDLIITIEDTGIGIDNEFITKIFDSFTQQESQDVKMAGGTGLGLTISQRLSKMMGGQITASSMPGKGSRFELHLYKIKISKIKVKEVILKEKSIDPGEIEFNKSKILIVDDVPSNRKFMVSALKDKNLQVYEADNGHVAITIAERIIPDLIITDIKMPGMDGYSLIKEIRKNKLLKKVKVIAATASVIRLNEKKAKDLSFDSLILKPVQIGTLFKTLTQLLPYKETKTKTYLNDSKKNKQVQKLTVKDKQKLYKELSTTYFNKWEEFKIHQPIDEVKKFCDDIIILGNHFKVNVLINYGNELISAMDDFNIDLALELINKYPGLISQFKHSNK